MTKEEFIDKTAELVENIKNISIEEDSQKEIVKQEVLKTIKLFEDMLVDLDKYDE